MIWIYLGFEFEINIKYYFNKLKVNYELFYFSRRIFFYYFFIFKHSSICNGVWLNNINSNNLKILKLM